MSQVITTVIKADGVRYTENDLKMVIKSRISRYIQLGSPKRREGERSHDFYSRLFSVDEAMVAASLKDMVYDAVNKTLTIEAVAAGPGASIFNTQAFMDQCELRPRIVKLPKSPHGAVVAAIDLCLINDREPLPPKTFIKSYSAGTVITGITLTEEILRDIAGQKISDDVQLGHPVWRPGESPDEYVARALVVEPELRVAKITSFLFDEDMKQLIVAAELTDLGETLCPSDVEYDLKMRFFNRGLEITQVVCFDLCPSKDSSRSIELSKNTFPGVTI